jgi:hypothetical protein
MTDSEIAAKMEMISSYAEGYQDMMFGSHLQRIGLTEQDLREGGPHPSLAFILRYQAFARAGGEQAGYGPIAHSAFSQLDMNEGDDIPPNELWEGFKAGCEQEGKGVNERLNKGVVTGLAELSNRRGNLFVWMRDEIEETGELKRLYLELKDIKGIGRKISTFILRDAVWLWGLEEEIRKSDRQYLHPIDRWVSRVAALLWPEFQDAGDDVVAQHIADECNRLGLSNVEFNQGAWYLSAEEVDGDEAKLESVIQQAT